MRIRVRLLQVFLLCCAAVGAQTYVISTVAGGLPPATPAAATSVSIGDPPRAAVDLAGNVYFASLHCVFKVDGSGTLTRIAGSGLAGYSGDGGPATSAQFLYPDGIAVDPQNNIYVSDRAANVVRKISAAGAISTIAGTGTAGFLGDGGSPSAAQLNAPAGLALDTTNRLYIADSGNNSIRRISADGATITTFAGNSQVGPAYGGDGGPAGSALLNGPSGVTVDGTGNVYIADTFNDRVRMVGSDGNINTVAGTGLAGIAGADGQPAKSSPLFLPADVAVSSSGTLYIADLGNSLVRTVSNGVIGTAAGNNSGAPPVDGQAATSVRLSGPTGVAVDGKANLYIAEGSIGSGSGLAAGSFHIWQVTAAGVFSAYAGNGWNSFAGDGGSAALGMLNTPAGIARDSKGNLYIADSRNHRVRKIAADGTITTIAGTGVPGFSGDGGPGAAAQLSSPLGVAVNADGAVFIADSGNNRIREILSDGTIGTYAGNGNAGFFGDGGNALLAALHTPSGVAVDNDGNLYVADTLDFRVRKIDTGDTITTIAGNGAQNSGGDGGQAINAALAYPVGVAAGANGNVFIADQGAGQVRQVSPTGIITTVPGGLGPASNGQLSGLRGVAADAAGSVYFADATGNQVRQVSPNGLVSIIAGNGTCCDSGDGGPALLAQLNGPWGLVPDGSGGLLIADAGNNAIRLLRPGSVFPVVLSVVNGASNRSGPVAPGEIVVLYGSGMGPSQLAVNQATGGFLGTQAAGVNVLMNGTPAPLLYVSAGQVSAIVPYGVTGSTVQIVVKYQGASSPAITVPLAASAPGIFTLVPSGQGQAAAVNQDNSYNSAAHPAPIGSIVTFYATGEGQTNPAGVDGKLAGSPAPKPALPVTVAIGGLNATLQYSGGSPGSTAGLLQINAFVPVGAPVSNAVQVAITINGVTSPPGVTIAVGGN